MKTYGIGVLLDILHHIFWHFCLTLEYLLKVFMNKLLNILKDAFGISLRIAFGIRV